MVMLTTFNSCRSHRSFDRPEGTGKWLCCHHSCRNPAQRSKIYPVHQSVGSMFLLHQDYTAESLTRSPFVARSSQGAHHVSSTSEERRQSASTDTHTHPTFACDFILHVPRDVPRYARYAQNTAIGPFISATQRQ